jgi:hypothetical protein
MRYLSLGGHHVNILSYALEIGYPKEVVILFGRLVRVTAEFW